jgi:hypothetical protein
LMAIFFEIVIHNMEKQTYQPQRGSSVVQA